MNKSKIEWCDSTWNPITGVKQCHIAAVPVFLKNNLAGIWGEPLIQEFPWEKEG